MLFEKYPYLGVFIYSIMTISCIIHITYELGFHNFNIIKSHHGILLFAIAGFITSLNTTLSHVSKAIVKKRREGML